MKLCFSTRCVAATSEGETGAAPHIDRNFGRSCGFNPPFDKVVTTPVGKRDAVGVRGRRFH